MHYAKVQCLNENKGTSGDEIHIHQFQMHQLKHLTSLRRNICFKTSNSTLLLFLGSIILDYPQKTNNRITR